MHSWRGFTLVEILIVVSILGILAALVVPKFSGATEQARSSAAHTQINAIRTQLQAFEADHRGQFPTLVDLQQGALDWDVLTGKTDADGTLNAAGALGPYLSGPPMNPFTKSTLVVEAGSPVATAGWTYDEDTATVRIIIPAGLDPTQVTDLGAGDYEQP
ncbi:MAG: prepilin-type N-terminal cleavage/methylation domain-containing protein [Phycisphaeraceae bacterium]